MDARLVIQLRDAAKAERQRLENLYDDCLRLTMPARKRFYTTKVDNADDIYDETGANAVAEFVSRMQAGLMPSFTEFVKLDASSLVNPRDKIAVDKDLDDINKLINNIFAFLRTIITLICERIFRSFRSCTVCI